jgi:WD40 repeat protein
MSAIEVVNGWGSVWAGFMTRSLIEVSVLLALVTLIWLPLRRRMSAQLGHGLFCLVLLKLIVPTPVTWPEWAPGISARQATDWLAEWLRPLSEDRALAQATPPEPPFALPSTGDFEVNVADPTGPLPVVTTNSPPRPVVTPPSRLSLSAWLMIAWGVVTSFMLLRFARAWIATRRLVEEAWPLGEGSLPVDVEALQRVAGVRTPIRWAISPMLDSPAVGGLVRPTVVIPPDFDEGLTPKQLSWVLLHELAHVRRGDLWVAAGQRLIQAIFFFHPAVHLASWIIDQLREYACDDVALAACKASRLVCGEGFLAVVSRSVERSPVASPALGLFESRMLIRRRLLRILDGRRKVHSKLSPSATVGLLAAALIVLPYSRSFEAWGRTQTAKPLTLNAQLDEPASYRPGEVWRKESQGESRSGVLALAYSRDGLTLASASEDGTIRLRDVASGQVFARLEGHKDTICGLSYSPDGKTLASVGYDRTVRLWDLATRKQLASLTGHANWVFAVAFSPDGRFLASAGHDKSVRVWDVARRTEAMVFLDNSGSVRTVAFSPDGRSVASAGADRMISIWSLSSRTRVARLEGHRGTIRALTYSLDGSMLATASEDGDLKLWEIRSARERRTLSGHSEMVVCLAFSPSGRTLASGSLDATVKLWDVPSCRELATLQGHSDGVSALAFAPGARRLATAGFDGTVRVWEPAAPVFSAASCLPFKGEPLALAFGSGGRTLLAAGSSDVVRWNTRDLSPLPSSKSRVATSVSVGPGGETLITGQEDGSVQMTLAETGKVVAEVHGEGGSARSVACSPEGRLLASVGDDGVVRLFRLDFRRVVREFTADASASRARLVKFSRDGRIVAVAGGELSLWDVATGQRLCTLRGHGKDGISSIAFSPDQKTLATTGLDGVVKLWNMETATLNHSLTYDACLSAEFSPDGRMLASAHRGGDVVLWDARDGRQLGLLKGHRGPVRLATFAPGGRVLGSAGVDGSVKLWNLGSLRQAARATLKGEVADAWAVAYSPDGSMLAMADQSGTITLWNTKTKRVQGTLEGHDRVVVKLAFSPDGTTLISGSCEGTVKLWDIATNTERYALTCLNGLSDLAISPDGKTLATAGEGRFVTLWDVKLGEEIVRLSEHLKRVHCIAFSPDGCRLVAGGGDLRNAPDAPGELTVWDVESQSVVTRLEGQTRAVLALAFSPDGSMLATAGFDQPVRIWDFASCKTQSMVGGLPAYVQSLAFSKDSRMLAWSGRGDGLVALHDAMTGAEVARLVGHHGLVRDIAFAPDGKGLATASADKTVKLWELP